MPDILPLKIGATGLPTEAQTNDTISPAIAPGSASFGTGASWQTATIAINQWTSVCYGNGLFVGVSSDGTNRVSVSRDGVNWQAVAAAQANLWNAVAYGNGLFVAVASSGTNRVMTSPDGFTWTARSAAEANSWFSVTYGNGLFVAVSADGINAVMTSPDGITWTARSAAISSLNGIAYGNGLFVAVASSGTNRVMTSPDGITWTARTAAQANIWQKITYGNGLFVAVSNSGTNRVMTSPDGTTWTARSIASEDWYSVTYGNGLFVAVGELVTAQNVATSPDGITWTSILSQSDSAWTAVTYGNGIFVALATSGTIRAIKSGKHLENVQLETKGSGGGLSSVSVTARLTGNGTSGSPLDIAQQSATDGQVLKWNNAASAWQPAADSVGYTGTVTTGTIPRVTGTLTLGNSLLTDNTTIVSAGGTAGFRLPNGTTAQRQVTPLAGTMRYNTDNSAFEYFSSVWETPLLSATATGLGTAGRVFFADANGRAGGDSMIQFDATNGTLNIMRDATGPPPGFTAFTEATLILQRSGINRFIMACYGGRNDAGWVRYNGTFASPTALVDGNEIARINFQAYDGTNIQFPAFFEGKVDGTVSAGAVPTKISFHTGTNVSNRPERIAIRSSGAVQFLNANLSRNAPVTTTSTSYVMTNDVTTTWLICDETATTTVTLPAATSWSGRELTIKNVTAFAVNSNASNVLPIGSNTAGTAILSATAGSWALLVSNGTNWVIMQRG